MSENSEKISGLIEKLKINDEEDIYEAEEEPVEPYEPIEELVKIGKKAVEPLIKLLSIPVGRWSVVYAAKILGEIGDSQAITPLILRLEVVTDESEFITDAIFKALWKFSLAVIDTLLDWYREIESPLILEAVDNIMSDFELYDGRVSEVFIKALSSPNEGIRYTAVKLLERNVPIAENYLETMLNDPSSKVANAAREELDKIQKMEQELEEDAKRIEEDSFRPVEKETKSGDYDKGWFDEMGIKTARFLFEVFYPTIGFNYRAETHATWRRNLKVLLDWDSISWDRKNSCVSNKEPMKEVINFMLKTLPISKEDRRKFSRHLNTARESLSLDLIFPWETEDKLWEYVYEYEEVETEEEFEKLKEDIFEEFGPPPYEFVKIIRPRKKT